MPIPVTYVPYGHPAAQYRNPAVKAYRSRTSRHLPTEVVEDPGALATVVILANHRARAHRREPGNGSCRIIPMSRARRIINDARRRWGIANGRRNE